MSATTYRPPRFKAWQDPASPSYTAPRLQEVRFAAAYYVRAYRSMLESVAINVPYSEFSARCDSFTRALNGFCGLGLSSGAHNAICAAWLKRANHCIDLYFAKTGRTTGAYCTSAPMYAPAYPGPTT